MQALLVLLQGHPDAVSGFVGGIVGAVVVELITWRWTLRRRKHPQDD